MADDNRHRSRIRSRAPIRATFVVVVFSMGNSLLKVIKKLAPLAIKESGRKLEGRVRHLGGKHSCPVCNSRVNAFQPLPEFYSDNLRKYGYTDGNSEIRKFYREHKGELFPVQLWNSIAKECGEYGAWMRCTGGGERPLDSGP